MTTIVFIVILAFFTWRGYQKGFVGAITKVLSVLIAYPAAIFFTKPFAHFIRTFINLDGLILFLIAGCTIFAVVSLAVTLLLNGLARLAPTNEFTETGSKIGGTIFGIIFGSLVGLIAVYTIDMVAKPSPSQIANQPPVAEQNDSKKTSDAEADSIQKYVMEGGAPVKDSFIDSTAKKLVSAAASTAVGILTDDKTSSQITKTLTQDPQATLTHFQNLTNDGELKQLLNKPEFQAELNRGNAQSLLENKDFQQLMQNPDMKAILATSEDPADSQLLEQAAAEKMIQAWKKISSLQNDPRVITIVSDPAFQAQLNSPNKLPLLMNPKMRELAELMFSENPAPIEEKDKTSDTLTPQTIRKNTRYVVEDITDGVKHQNPNTDEASAGESPTSEAPEQKLYRWTDEDGKVHFSDKPIKNQSQ